MAPATTTTRINRRAFAVFDMARRRRPPARGSAGDRSSPSLARRRASATNDKWSGRRPPADASGRSGSRIDPRRVPRLPGLDGGELPDEVPHLVRPGEEHEPGERVDLERQVLVARQVDDLGL